MSGLYDNSFAVLPSLLTASELSATFPQHVYRHVIDLFTGSQSSNFNTIYLSLSVKQTLPVVTQLPRSSFSGPGLSGSHLFCLRLGWYFLSSSSSRCASHTAPGGAVPIFSARLMALQIRGREIEENEIGYQPGRRGECG